VSIRVELAELAGKIEALDGTAYLVTVNSDGSPHIVSVVPRWDDRGNLTVDVGQRTFANADRHAGVTLLWPAPPGESYALIVDGDAARVGDSSTSCLSIEPRRAVLHRTHGGDDSSPSCVTVLERS